MVFVQALENITYEKVLENEQMKRHTSIGVGGEARYFVSIKSLHVLNNVLECSRRYKIRCKIIGNGTNLIFSDSGYNGLIISIKGISDVFFKVDEVKAMAGATIAKLIDFCAENKLGGIEELSGIPATIGGAIKMNAGAFGKCISDYVTRVEVLKNGKIISYNKADCDFSYRTSKFSKSKEIITAVYFKFDRDGFSMDKLKKFRQRRNETQPFNKSCGSIFKNPENLSAGKLIEDAGLKGFSLGGARVSTKHANFIVNEKNAKACDVYNLIKYIKEKIKSVYGITLQEEVEYVGEFQ